MQDTKTIKQRAKEYPFDFSSDLEIKNIIHIFAKITKDYGMF